jgi:hypothetical protein
VSARERQRYAGGGEHEHEPVPGLPAELPPGERILWQGSPTFAALALRAFHVRKVAVYFALLLAWRLASALYDGEAFGTALAHALWLLPLALLGLALLVGMAWHGVRTTIYTITTRRVVMRFGLALPMTVNIPYTIVESAGLRHWADGTGDLTLALGGSGRISWLHLWPHARPWKLERPQPMLRGLDRPDAVAQLLTDALAGMPDLKALAPAQAPSADADRSHPLAHA